MLSDQLLEKTVLLSYEECKTDIVGSFFRAIDFSIPNPEDDNNNLSEITNRSLTDQELTLMLLINRLIDGDYSFCERVSGRLIKQSSSPPCYFYVPDVDRKIDDFFDANGVDRQYQCHKREPVINSEKDWLETHSVNATLMELFFSELAEYNNIEKDLVSRAIKRAKYHHYSAFRTRVPGKFDVMAYLLRNPDVLAGGIDPYKHYVLYGYDEGRNFDWGLYQRSTEN
jgi:hypothetical protein